MFITLDCIALRTVKYNDKHSILSVYTRQRGRLSFLVPAGQGREASRRRAIMMPMGRFTCVGDIRETRSLQTMRDVATRGVSTSGDPMKGMTLFFLADFLNAALREAQPDETLFRFIDYMTERFVTMRRGVANFHICFLVRLQRYLGIEPDVSTYRTGYLFDMTDGVFRQSAPLHGKFLDAVEAQAAFNLLRMTPDNLHLYRMSHTERNRVLDRLLEFYSIHFGNLQSPGALDVLRDMFRQL